MMGGGGGGGGGRANEWRPLTGYLSHALHLPP